MDVVISKNLNELLNEWPVGQIYSTAYMRKLGYSDQQIKNYLAAGWIERLGIGAYKKRKDQVEWPAGLSVIQKQLELPIHVGGKSALGLLGKAQYLELGKINLNLYGPSGAYLSTWFKRYPWSANISYQQSNLFEESRDDFANKDFGYTSKEPGGHSIVISSAERAILEYIDGLPLQGSYEEALELMENLTSLRPQVLQRLLESCKSLKVRRLFLHLAAKINHPWVRKLEMKTIQLGTGKRVIFKNGKFDPKYQITVPVGSDEE